jgi:hypothetical protein
MSDSRQQKKLQPKFIARFVPLVAGHFPSGAKFQENLTQ